MEPQWNPDMITNNSPEPQVNTLSASSISHHHLATQNHANIRCESCGKIFTRGKYSYVLTLNSSIGYELRNLLAAVMRKPILDLTAVTVAKDLR
jgi:hypothetical protein